MAAEGVEHFEVMRLAGPTRTDADGLVETRAAHSTKIPPPAVAAQELAHTISTSNTNY
jgi:hypothetical protein